MIFLSKENHHYHLDVWSSGLFPKHKRMHTSTDGLHMNIKILKQGKPLRRWTGFPSVLQVIFWNLIFRVLLALMQQQKKLFM